MTAARRGAAGRANRGREPRVGANRALRIVDFADVRPNPLVQTYLTYERDNRRLARKTVLQKRLVLGQLVQFLAERFGVDAADPDVLLLADLADLQAWQCGLGIQDSSAATYTSVARTFYRWAASSRSGRRLSSNPAEDLLVPTAPAGLPHPIADEDLYQALDLAAAADPRMYCWLLLAASCGLRCCEIAQLDRRHVRIDEANQTVRLIIKNSKGNKTRLLYGGPGLAAALRPLLPVSGPVFTSVQRGTGGRRRQIPPELVSAYINKFLRKVVGVADTAHCLRHWFGSATYQARRDLRATQEAMGHASPITTAGYAAVVDGHGGDLGQAMDVILSTRGRIDARKAHLQPVATAIDRTRPEAWVLHLRVEGRSWPEIADTFGITVDDARRIARTAVFGGDQAAS